MYKLPSIFLSKKFHRNDYQILLRFRYNEKLISITKSIPKTKWSKSLNSWYINNSPENLKLIFSAFKGHTHVNSKNLFKKVTIQPRLYTKRVRVLTKKNRTVLNNFYKYLKGKRYSNSTLKIYTHFVADFIEYHNNKQIETLTNRDVELFVENSFVKKGYSISTHRQFVSAIKQFVNFKPDCNIDNLNLQRPKKSNKLPSVLSQEEIIDLIRCTQNLKHRAIIALLYSCGLRVSELISLKLTNINIDRKQLFIKNSKGRKDRYVSFGDSFIPLLSNYFISYKPKYYFVEGANGNTYSAESIRQFIKRNCKIAQIYKTVTPHTLRHSYATHLLENGVDVHYIQSLLGHARPETTMIYTHVKRKDLMQISNPLDTALLKIKKADKTNQNVLLSQNIK
jgi:integrase/recombinase XerD